MSSRPSQLSSGRRIAHISRHSHLLYSQVVEEAQHTKIAVQCEEKRFVCGTAFGFHVGHTLAVTDKGTLFAPTSSQRLRTELAINAQMRAAFAQVVGLVDSLMEAMILFITA